MENVHILMNQVPFCSKIPAFTPKNPIYVHTITCLRSVFTKNMVARGIMVDSGSE
jgi:hypothetical protein